MRSKSWTRLSIDGGLTEAEENDLKRMLAHYQGGMPKEDHYVEEQIMDMLIDGGLTEAEEEIAEKIEAESAQYLDMHGHAYRWWTNRDRRERPKDQAIIYPFGIPLIQNDTTYSMNRL